jgi:hypothetical protein
MRRTVQAVRARTALALDERRARDNRRLRYHGEYGFEVQLMRDGELFFRRRNTRGADS